MNHDFLKLQGKPILIFGVANRRSVAYHIGKVLAEAGAKCLYSVRDEQVRRSVARLLGDSPVYTCNVQDENEIAALRAEVERDHGKLYGLVHSIAYADYSSGPGPFHETGKEAFLQAVDISCFSLIAISRTFAHLLDANGAVVTISISTTRMAAENYGYMAPVKAALDSAVVFLAKSFSRFSRVRFNAVAAGLLKTSSSAAIPGYVDAYLFAEQVIPRRAALQTEEVANVAAFLLSPRSSGINAQRIVVDAGMSINYFDRDLVRRVVESGGEPA